MHGSTLFVARRVAFDQIDEPVAGNLDQLDPAPAFEEADRPHVLGDQLGEQVRRLAQGRAAHHGRLVEQRRVPHRDLAAGPRRPVVVDQLERRPDQPLGQLIDSGYYDQAHFNRDFKAYMGMTPLAYFRLPREALRRAVEERRRVLGAPVQGLHVSKS